MSVVKSLFNGRKQKYTDVEVVEGIAAHNRVTEEWFYRSAHRYFSDSFNDVFFDKDKKQEIFQTAFLKIWTEIENGKICVRDQQICRQQRNGECKPMTCSLNTFLMTFAKNEYREMVRSNRLDTYDEVFESEAASYQMVTIFDEAEDIDVLKNRIVDDCIQRISPRCAEILTLFYYEGKSLDEILMIRSDKNSSKNGLKSAKNKCMNTLREGIISEYRRYNITM